MSVPLRAALYRRTRSIDEAHSQRVDVECVVEARGRTLVNVFKDTEASSVGGPSLQSALQSLLQAAARHEFEVVSRRGNKVLKRAVPLGLRCDA